MSRFGFGGSISFQRQHNHRDVPRDLLREKGAPMCKQARRLDADRRRKALNGMRGQAEILVKSARLFTVLPFTREGGALRVEVIMPRQSIAAIEMAL
jgi:hypothetical protein